MCNKKIILSKLKRLKVYTIFVADIEIVNILKQELDDSSHKIITTVSMEKLNRELLLELEVKEEDLHNSYRKYLKQLILENIPGLLFKNRHVPMRHNCYLKNM